MKMSILPRLIYNLMQNTFFKLRCLNDILSWLYPSHSQASSWASILPMVPMASMGTPSPGPSEARRGPKSHHPLTQQGLWTQ